MKKVSYFICESVSTTRLWEYVSNKCEEGWIPTGGISIECDAPRGSIKYFQAMIKEMEDEPCTKN